MLHKQNDCILSRQGERLPDICIKSQMPSSFENKKKKKNKSTSNKSTALLGIHPLKDFQLCNVMKAELETGQLWKKVFFTNPLALRTKLKWHAL